MSNRRRALLWMKWQVLVPMLYAYQAVVARLLGMWLRWFGLKKRPNSALVMEVTATSVGNLGDQAMLAGALHLLHSEGVTDVGVITWHRDYPWQRYVPKGYHAFALDGVLNMLLVPWRISRYERFYYLAADMLDGGYSVNHVRGVLHLATIASVMGLRATFCGFSFNRPSHPAVLKYLRRLPPRVRLCCRDPLSHSRVTQLLQRDAELVADIAFNLPPDDASPLVQQVQQWIDQQRDRGRQIMAVNLHHQLLRPSQQDLSLAQLTEMVAATLCQVAAQREVAFVLIPHVYRGKINDLEMLQQLRASMPSSLEEQILLPLEQLWAGEVKALCSRMDLVLSGRMHLAIAALGQGVPVLCLTYQGDKFEGLMAHFGLSGNTLAPGEAADREQFANRVVFHLDQSAALKRKVRDALPRVMALSKRNV